MSKLKFKPDPQTGRLSSDDTKKYFSTVGFAIFTLIAITSGVTFGATFLIGRFAPELFKTDYLKILLNAVIIYGLAMPSAYLILRKLPKDTNPSEKLGFGKIIGLFFVCVTFMSIGNSISNIAIGLFESIKGDAIVNSVDASISENWIANLVILVFLAPLFEELFFRKILCDRLLPLGELSTIFISAALFGLAHGNFYQVFYGFFVGLIFSAIYVRTGRIRYSLTFHIILNFLSTIFVPWVLQKLSPILTEEMLKKMTDALASTDPAVLEQMSEELIPYMLPMMLLGAYELLFSIGSIVGVIVFIKFVRKFKFREGLLPPSKESRVANLFCNAGVALAIGAFTVRFIYSLFL